MRRQPPKTVYVVFSIEHGPEYVAESRKEAIRASAQAWRQTEVIRYERHEAKSVTKGGKR